MARLADKVACITGAARPQCTPAMAIGFPAHIWSYRESSRLRSQCLF